MFHFQCRGLVLFTIFVQRIVGRQFCVQNSVSGLSASNFVCEICSAGCREAISCAIFVQRIVGKQFRVRNLFSGLSASNFVCKICSASCRQAILCAIFVQRIVGKQFRVQNLFSGLSGGNFVCKIPPLASPPPSSPPPRRCCRGGADERLLEPCWSNNTSNVAVQIGYIDSLTNNLQQYGVVVIHWIGSRAGRPIPAIFSNLVG